MTGNVWDMPFRSTLDRDSENLLAQLTNDLTGVLNLEDFGLAPSEFRRRGPMIGLDVRKRKE